MKNAAEAICEMRRMAGLNLVPTKVARDREGDRVRLFALAQFVVGVPIWVQHSSRLSGWSATHLLMQFRTRLGLTSKDYPLTGKGPFICGEHDPSAEMQTP